MSDGSSSAVPVISPGPSLSRKLLEARAIRDVQHGWAAGPRDAVISFRPLATFIVVWPGRDSYPLLLTKQQASSTSFRVSLCRRTVVNGDIRGRDRDR